MNSNIIALPVNYEPCIVEDTHLKTPLEKTVRCIQDINKEIDHEIMCLQMQIEYLQNRKGTNEELIEEVSYGKGASIS